MCEVIAFTSGKGGVGKTTLCAALALCLSMEKKVLAIDCDFVLGNLDALFELSEKAVFDLGDILEGRCEPGRAILIHPRKRKLHFIPAATREIAGDAEEEFLTLIKKLREKYDYIFLDCPAGVGKYFKMSLSAADRAIIVSTQDKNAARDADRAAYIMEECGITDMSLIINRFSLPLIKAGKGMNIDDIIDAVKVRLLGVVPEDMEIRNTIFLSSDIFSSRSKGARGIYNIAKRMKGEYVPLMKLK